MENFLEDFKRIINSFKYTNTYKIVLAYSILECSKDFVSIEGENIYISFEELADYFMEFYWDQYILGNNIQSRNKVNLIFELVQNFYRTKKYELSVNFEYGKYEKYKNEYFLKDEMYRNIIFAISKILPQNVLPRFLILNGESLNNVYKLDYGNKYLIMKSKDLVSLKNNEKELMKLIIDRYYSMLDDLKKNKNDDTENKILQQANNIIVKEKEETLYNDNEIEIVETIEKNTNENTDGKVGDKQSSNEIEKQGKELSKYDLAIYEMKELLRNNRLIGNVLIRFYDDDEFFKLINDKAEKTLILNFSKTFIPFEDSYDVIISLSFIALKYYSGNFWENVEKCYENIYQMAEMNSQKIRNKIIDILKDFRGNDKRYIEFPIKNAIVPYAFIDKYYDFMFDIYKLNFKCSLPENVEDEIRYVFNAIYEKINADSDELSIDVTNKTYKLIKSTQNIIKNEENLSELCELSAKVLERIQAYMWNYNSVLESNSYFNTSFERFIQTSRRDKINLTEREKKEYKSRWKPSFRLIDNEIYLITPIHKVPEKYDPTNITIWAYNDNDLISLEEKPVVEQGIGYYTVDPQNIVINNPLGKLSYMISEGKDEIYNSQESLYRKYILFNEDGDEIKTDSNYDGVCSIVFQDIAENGIEIRTKKEFYNIGEIFVKQGNCFTLDGEIITFTGKVNNGINGDIDENCKAKINNSYIDIYNSLKCILFNFEDNEEHIGIEVNGKRSKLVDIDYKISSINKSVQIDISDYEDGYYNIKIFDFVNNKTIYEKSFVYDSELSLSCEKSSKRNYILRVESELVGIVERNVNLDNSLTAEVSFEYDNQIITYELCINVPLYKIDDNNYCEMDDYLWGRDLNTYSIISLLNFSFDQIEMKDSKMRSVGEPIVFTSKQKSIDAQVIRNLESNDEFYLYLKNSSTGQSIVLWILNACKLIDTETIVNYDKNKEELVINTAYIGKNDLFMRLKNNNGTTIFERKINNPDIYTNNNLFSGINYTIEYVEKIQSSMFYTEEKVIGKRDIFFMKYDDLIGKYCRVNSIIYDDYKNKIIDRNLIINNVYVQFNEYIEGDIYLGELYKMQMGEKITFKDVNPVKVELLSKNYSPIVRCMITTMEDDGLLYDMNNRLFVDEEMHGNKYILGEEYEVSLIKKREE